MVSGLQSIAGYLGGVLCMLHLPIVGTDSTFIIVCNAICATDWTQDPGTGYEDAAIFIAYCWVLTAVNLSK